MCMWKTPGPGQGGQVVGVYSLVPTGRPLGRESVAREEGRKECNFTQKGFVGTSASQMFHCLHQGGFYWLT